MSRHETHPVPQAAGVLKAIAYRPHRRQPMIEVDACELLAGKGIREEDRKQSKRQVTLLSLQAWDEACRELGRNLPWYTRRANFLVEHFDLRATIGRVIRIGQAEVRVHGESKPCALMDWQCRGLRGALQPNGRGGVYGEVIVGGVVRRGDEIVFVAG